MKTIAPLLFFILSASVCFGHKVDGKWHSEWQTGRLFRSNERKEHKHPAEYEHILRNYHKEFHNGKDTHAGGWHYACIADDDGNFHYHEEGPPNYTNSEGKRVKAFGTWNEKCPPESPPNIYGHRHTLTPHEPFSQGRPNHGVGPTSIHNGMRLFHGSNFQQGITVDANGITSPHDHLFDTWTLQDPHIHEKEKATPQEKRTGKTSTDSQANPQIFSSVLGSPHCTTKWYANEKIIINRIGLTRGAKVGYQHTYTLTSVVLLKDDASIIDLSDWTLSLSAKFSAYTYTLALDDLAFDGNTLELTDDTLSPDRSVFGLTDRERQPLFDYRLKNGRNEYVDMAITGSPIANTQDRFSQEDTVVLLRQPHAEVADTDWRRYQCNMWVIETAPRAPSLRRNKTTTWAALKQ